MWPCYWLQCEAGHVVCGTCRNSHGQVCGGAATYAACIEVDAFVRDAKHPCVYDEFGCKSFVVYYEAGDHHRACQWAPCSCPDPSCAFFGSPARLLNHLTTNHSPHHRSDLLEAVQARGGADAGLARPRRQGGPVRVPRVRVSAQHSHRSVSSVCVRANGDAAAWAPQFK
uniref:SIAH-type domain-containing protein n=1 Tax=Arundo donax TaxID=35708 RepID=A0A0A9BKE4_ARUDO